MAEPLGLRLKAVREFYGWSQRELAKRAGVPNSAISVIEQGSVSPSVSSLEKVLSGFSISLADFFAISVNNPSINVTHPEAGPEPTALLADYPSRMDRELSLRFFRAQPGDAPEHHLSRGQTRILLVAGAAIYHAPGIEQPLVRGSSVCLSATTVFRIQPVGGQAEWVMAALA